MYKLENGNISLTRGDTLHIPVTAKDYDFQAEDKIEMTVRTSADIGAEVLFRIEADADQTLHIRPEHTGNLAYGTYRYDVQATLHNGDVVTYGPYKFRVLKEVTYDG